MQLAKLTIGKAIGITIFSIFLVSQVQAQSNSPFSRYGIGDLSNPTNIVFRGMGGANIASTSERFMNPNNPASYSYLGSALGSVKDIGQIMSFDVGTEFSNNTLRQKTPLDKYNSKNLLFNYMQFGTQLSKKGNWGMMFGLQPISRVNYSVFSQKRITNVDSAVTVYEGNGGAYKAFIGTAIRKSGFSFGFNTGYIFAKKYTTSSLSLLNDSIEYYESSSATKLNYGNIFLQTGALYALPVGKKDSKYSKKISFGLNYELKNTMRSSTDVEHFTFNSQNSSSPLSGRDTIFYQSNIRGSIVIPQTLGLGVRYESVNKDYKLGNTFAAALDFTQTNWSEFRINGAPDQVQNTWQVKTGFEFRPVYNPRSFWSRSSYRAGANYGKDYVNAGGNMPTYAITLGASLPVRLENYELEQERPYINFALEFGKRGNNTINISENFLKVAVSVSLSDLWYVKRKYD